MVDWNILWEKFWKRYEEFYPKERRLQKATVRKVQEIWEKSSPFIGEKIDSSLSINEEGKIAATSLDWVIWGSLASVIIEEIENENEKLKKEIKKLKKVKDIRIIKKIKMILAS